MSGYKVIKQRYALTPCVMPHASAGGADKPIRPKRTNQVIAVSTKTQVLLYLIALSLCDIIIPLPLTAMILIMVLYRQPKWFHDLVREIYDS